MREVRRMAAVVAAFILPAFVGCESAGVPESEATSSMTEAKVSGTVKVLGKAAGAGEVAFNPANVNRKTGVRTAKVDKDGHYEVTTLIGPNTVSVSGKGISDNPKVGYVSQKFDVKEGTNAHDIEIEAKK